MTDDLVASLTSNPKYRRSFCYFADEWLPQQTEERKKAVLAALENPRWKTAAIFNLLKEHGFDRKYNVLRIHRAGDCACGK